jgi:hypothetical protein
MKKSRTEETCRKTRTTPKFQEIYKSPVYGEETISVSTPLYDDEGQKMAVSDLSSYIGLA